MVKSWFIRYILISLIIPHKFIFGIICAYRRRVIIYTNIYSPCVSTQLILYNNHIQHIEAETRWPPFFRRHFRTHFLEWKCYNIGHNFTEVFSKWPDQQYSSIGSDNGLAPIRRQAIIWTNDGYITDAYMRHSASMSEIFCEICMKLSLEFLQEKMYMALTLGGLHQFSRHHDLTTKFFVRYIW